MEEGGLLACSAPLGTTPIHTVASVIEQLSGPNRFLVSAAFIAAALMSVEGLRSQDRVRSVALLLPQQTLLVITAIGAILAAISGHYADGVPRPTLFILADQFPPILIAAAHTVAIVTHAKNIPG